MESTTSFAPLASNPFQCCRDVHSSLGVPGRNRIVRWLVRGRYFPRVEVSEGRVERKGELAEESVEKVMGALKRVSLEATIRAKMEEKIVSGRDGRKSCWKVSDRVEK
eukprot:scaffold3501_cov81-Cylindrotheca_fusiformis.AAC.1